MFQQNNGKPHPHCSGLGVGDDDVGRAHEVRDLPGGEVDHQGPLPRPLAVQPEGVAELSPRGNVSAGGRDSDE